MLKISKVAGRSECALLLVLVLSLAACSDAPQPRAKAAATDEVAVDLEVGPQSDESVRVGGTADSPLMMRLRPGDLSGPGRLVAGPAQALPAPTLAGFIAAGDAVEISAPDTLTGAADLSFPIDPDQPRRIPVVLRYDEAAGWHPVAVGDAGVAATAERGQFSPHLPGWLDPGLWWQDLTSKVDTGLRGRSEPPTCSPVGPAWFDLSQPALDVLHTCTADNPEGSVARAELRLRSNRGIVQEVAVPPGTAFTWAQEQSESVRAYTRNVTGRNIVLLAPGKDMTLAYRRPPLTTDVQVSPVPSNFAMVADLLMRLTDLPKLNDSLVAAVAALADCAGVNPAMLSGTRPSGLNAVTATFKSVGLCLVKLAADPRAAAAIATEAVAAANGVSKDVAVSDRRFAGKVDRLSGALQIAGKALKSYELAGLAFSYWEFNGETLGRGVGDGRDPGIVLLTLRAPAKPKPLPPPKPLARPLLLGLGGSFDDQQVLAPEAEGVAYVAARLGRPSSDDPKYMCGPENRDDLGRQVRWDQLTVFVRDDMSSYEELGEIEGSRVVGWKYAVDRGQDRMRLRTAEGLGLGSTLAQVQAAYPDGYDADRPGAVTWEVFRGDLSSLTFTFKGGVATLIESGGGCPG